MRRFYSVALIGLAVAAVATDASAQGRQGGRRGGVDSARVDSLRAIRQHRVDSLRAAGVLDTAHAGRRGRGGFGPAGPGGRGGLAPMAGRSGLMGIQLNDNEKGAVKSINEKYRTELQQLREANKGAARDQNQQMMAQVQAIAERQQADVRAALTAEHQKQFDENVAKRKEQMQKRGGRRGQRPPTPRAR
jgi:hypothetical protein